MSDREQYIDASQQMRRFQDNINRGLPSDAPYMPEYEGALSEEQIKKYGITADQAQRFDALSPEEQEQFLQGKEHAGSGGYFATDQQADAYEAVMGPDLTGIPKRGIRTDEDAAREKSVYTAHIPDGFAEEMQGMLGSIDAGFDTTSADDSDSDDE